MAGVAGYGAMSAEICIVDGEHHFHHSAGTLFCGLLVAVEMAFYVAVLAANAECEGDVTHRRDELIGRNIGQHFDIFKGFAGGFCSRKCRERQRRRVLVSWGLLRSAGRLLWRSCVGSQAYWNPQ